MVTQAWSYAGVRHIRYQLSQQGASFYITVASGLCRSLAEIGTDAILNSLFKGPYPLTSIG